MRRAYSFHIYPNTPSRNATSPKYRAYARAVSQGYAHTRCRIHEKPHFSPGLRGISIIIVCCQGRDLHYYRVILFSCLGGGTPSLFSIFNTLFRAALLFLPGEGSPFLCQAREGSLYVPLIIIMPHLVWSGERSWYASLIIMRGERGRDLHYYASLIIVLCQATDLHYYRVILFACLGGAPLFRARK